MYCTVDAGGVDQGDLVNQFDKSQAIIDGQFYHPFPLKLIRGVQNRIFAVSVADKWNANGIPRNICIKAVK